MQKAKLTEILKDDDKLNDYLLSLQNELDVSNDVDDKLNTMINNIFALTDNFNDRRSLKSQLIESVNELLKLKQQITNDKIKNSKTIFDIAKTKRDLEIKEKQNEVNNNLITGTGSILLEILNRLDKKEIYPRRLTDEELANYKVKNIKEMGFNEIIDIPEQVETKEESKEIKQIEIKPNQISILDLQKQLDKEG